ncbi:MAG: tungstate ABC transporter substrate-binding protein WtpA [Anaerolineales bacterium]
MSRTNRLARALRLVGVMIVSLTLAACARAEPSAMPAASAARAAEATPPVPATVIAPTPAVTPIPSATNTPHTEAPRGQVRLRVFEAGSLMIPFDAIEHAFEAQNPDIDVETEAHGSIQVIRHVTDIHEKIDIVASADHALLSMLMYGSMDPDTGEPFADWNIRFATNRMVLAYSPTAAGADIPTTDNWAKVITRPGTRIGLADPRFDACGYRELMVLQLAETLYGEPRILEDVVLGRFITPITTEEIDGVTLIHVPEVLEPRPKSTILMRGSSIQLIPLLQSGDLDYIFEYESVAAQHQLAYIVLPDEVNLSDPEQADTYAQVAVKLDFRRFASVEPTFTGEVIAYGLTIPSNAPQPEAAARFVAFLLGPEGQRIMAENHHPLLDPPTVDHPENLPTLLQPLCAAEAGE